MALHPEPYYTDSQVTLYHGDCREILAWLDADVLVTDPPYGMAYADRQGVAIKNDHSTAARDDVLAAWGDLRPALMFGTWRVPRPPSSWQVIVWDKSEGNGMGGSSTSPWGLSHEEIYLIGKWPAITPGGRAREGGRPARDSGVIRVANYNTQATNRPDHPTPKPVSLMERLLMKCPPGVVAEPFAGSGSTLMAAKNLGRRAIGVELDERYCEVAAKRLTQDTFVRGGCLMTGLHPKTWDDGVMPLDEFPTADQLRIAAQVASPTPPPRWLRFEGCAIESRAWHEWHWARGKKLKHLPASPAPRPKIPVVLRFAVYERDGHTCLHCGTTENLSLDHIHPFSRGGKDTFDNLQTLCRSCNSRKGARV